jgi:histidyl-tRNA synthetase
MGTGMSFNRLKGTYDITPRESDFYRAIHATVSEILENHGYKSVTFPVIEHASLFARGVGESSDIVVKKEMYVFEDRGHRMIALRPEGTASAVRLYLENGLAMQGYSAKMYYTGPMFRAENPQAGRYRQFVQIGAEYLGDGNPYADVELIRVNREILDALGVGDYTVVINTIGDRACRPKHLDALKEYFSGKLGELCEDCVKRYETNVLRILDCKEEKCRPVIERAPSLHDLLCGDCRTHFEEVKKGLADAKVPFTVDPRLVRGLDYYNRTVFEIKSASLGAQSTLSAGGRYDYLIKELGGMETPGAGFAIGVERLGMAIENSLKKNKEDYYRPPAVYVAFIGEEFRAQAAGVIAFLAGKGISAVTEYRYSALKKHLKAADSMKASYALFIGEDEVKKGVFTLRNLSDGAQFEGRIEELASRLKGKA